MDRVWFETVQKGFPLHYTSRWASYHDAGGAVAGCAPCVFFPISACFDPFLVASLYCRFHTLTDIDPLEELGTFRVADFLAFFECTLPDNSQCGIVWQIPGKTNKPFNRYIICDGCVR